MAKELEKRGSHILGIKDMSGLLKPMAAKKLVDDAQTGNRHSDPSAYTRYVQETA